MSIQQQVQNIITSEFSPSVLEVVNESHMHSVPEGAESHFKLVVVSDVFSGMPKVRRHQAVYQALSELLAGSIHALAMHLYTEEEWRISSAPDSPQCMGGSKQAVSD